MTREFIYYKIFDKHWSELGLTDDDLMALEIAIMENPEIGDLIPGTGGLRKMRFVLPGNNKGKSGGARVLYVDFVSYEKTVLMNVYSKNEKDNITDNEKQQLKSIIKELEKELRK